MLALTFSHTNLIGNTSAWKGVVFKSVGSGVWYIGILGKIE
jgi:hypothetical protein